MKLLTIILCTLLILSCVDTPPKVDLDSLIDVSDIDNVENIDDTVIDESEEPETNQLNDHI